MCNTSKKVLLLQDSEVTEGIDHSDQPVKIEPVANVEDAKPSFNRLVNSYSMYATSLFVCYLCS